MSRILNVIFLLIVGFGFAVTAFVAVLQLSLIGDSSLETETLKQIAQAAADSNSFGQKLELYISYHLGLSFIVWQAWVVFGMGIGVFAVWAHAVFKAGSRGKLRQELAKAKEQYRQEHEKLTEAEQKLVTLDNNLLAAHENSAEGFLLVDDDTAIRHLNDKAADMFGHWSKEEKTYIGTPLEHVVPALAKTEVIDALKKCLRERESWAEEVHMEEQHVWLVARIFPAAQGAFVSLLDITHRKQAADIASASEVLLSQVIAEAPYPMAIVDLEWNYKLISPPWLKQFHMENQEVLGHRHLDLIPNFPPEREQVEKQLQQGREARGREERIVMNEQEEFVDWEIVPWKNVHDEVSGYMMFAEMVTEEVQAKQRLKSQRQQEQQLAYHDALTGLPNRQLFHDRLNMALARAYRELGRVGLMFLDLDGFKAVNDTLGHDAGDMLLKQVSERLKQCIRTTDTAARLGGDEFTLILSGVKTVEDVTMIAQKVIDLVSEPYDLAGQEARISTSIGISIYPDNTNSAADMIKQADEAMYVAKKSGKNTYRYFRETSGTTEDAHKAAPKEVEVA